MKKLILAAAFILSMTGVWAQKVDQRLLNQVQQVMSRRAASDKVTGISVQAFLKEGVACPTAELEGMGVKVRFVIDNVAALWVPADKLQEVAELEDIFFLQYDAKARLANNEARKVTAVEKVNTDAVAKMEGLSTGYTGKGVILAVVDDGIQFAHPAFNDATGKSRVKQMMLYDASDVPDPAVTDDLDYLTSKTDDNGESHGTHTATTAAGIDLGNGLQGMAPGAELVLAGLGKNQTETNIADAIKRVGAYADTQGKPCVINISMSKINLLRDGSSIVAKAVKEFTNSGEKAGRAVILSAGNSGGNLQSIICALPAPAADGYQLKTVVGATMVESAGAPNVKYPNVSNSSGIFIYSKDGKDFTAELKLVNIKTGEVLSSTDGQLYLDNEFTKKSDLALKKTQVVNVKNEKVPVYEKKVTHNADEEKNTIIKNPDLRLAIFVKGNTGQVIEMTSEEEASEEPAFFVPATLEGKGYTKGSGDVAVSGFICEESAIGVGAFVTKDHWTDMKNTTHQLRKYNQTGAAPSLGQIAPFSSWGTDDNGLKHPTVLAPGQMVESAFNMENEEAFYVHTGHPRTGPMDTEYHFMTGHVVKNEHDYYYGAYEGTSMAAPVVSGIVALWMEANPKLTVKQIKEIMKETCDNDDNTTIADNIPSKNVIQAGYGKINALKGLKKILASTGIESAVKENGEKHDGHAYNLRGERVDKSQKGLVIYNGKVYQNK